MLYLIVRYNFVVCECYILHSLFLLCAFPAEELDDGSWSEMLETDPSDLDVRVIVRSGQVVVTGRRNPTVFHWQRRVCVAPFRLILLHFV